MPGLQLHYCLAVPALVLFLVQHTRCFCVAPSFPPSYHTLPLQPTLRLQQASSRTPSLLFMSTEPTTRSYISSIQSKNLAGIASSVQTTNTTSRNADETVVVVDFQQQQPFAQNFLAAVTGETGSGKSVLVARALDLIMGGGGKAATTLVDGTTEAFVQVELYLSPEYWQAAAESSFNNITPTNGKVVLRRAWVESSSTSDDGRNRRRRSICHINDQPVTLKTLSAFCRPLFTVVDAGAAASALAKPETRLAMLTNGIGSATTSGSSGSREGYTLLRHVDEAKRRFRQARRARKQLERELEQHRVFSASFRKDNVELLSHWIEELDDYFDQRLQQFCQRATQVEDESSVLYAVSQRLGETIKNSREEVYDALIDFRDAILSLEEQLASAQNAADSLSTLASPNSAATAVEQARSLLFDIGDDDETSRLSQAVERSHELLNEVELALRKCARFIEEEERGVLRTLEMARETCPVPLDDVENILFDWGSLCRKHGISLNDLPSCHEALKNERDGTVTARERLPEAKRLEKEELAIYEDLAEQLTAERQRVATSLSGSVSRRLPALGMEKSLFAVRIEPRTSVDSDDLAEFFLLQEEKDTTRRAKFGGGRINEAASSGEKARVLLAIECSLPGAVGASCREKATAESPWSGLPPIAVVYDEIDAHVGGRAAVAVASMLVDQSRWSHVIAITHSPSVAAVADSHLVVHRFNSDIEPAASLADVEVVEGEERKKELARMASGDLANEEAEVFAEALLRDLSKVKQIRT